MWSHIFLHIFEFRLVLVELIAAPEPQQRGAGFVRMDPAERHPILSHLMVPYGRQVSKKRKLQTTTVFTPYSMWQCRGCTSSGLVSSFTSSESVHKSHLTMNHLPHALWARPLIVCGRAHSSHRSVWVGSKKAEYFYYNNFNQSTTWK